MFISIETDTAHLTTCHSAMDASTNKKARTGSRPTPRTSLRQDVATTTHKPSSASARDKSITSDNHMASDASNDTNLSAPSNKVPTSNNHTSTTNGSYRRESAFESTSSNRPLNSRSSSSVHGEQQLGYHGSSSDVAALKLPAESTALTQALLKLNQEEDHIVPNISALVCLLNPVWPRTSLQAIRLQTTGLDIVLTVI